MREKSGGVTGMKANIDRSGRIARAISGLICLVGGLALGFSGWPESAMVRWTLSVLFVLAGGFQFFEAKQAW